VLFNQNEIDHHVLKLIVGLVALSLASLTAWLSDHVLGSISASYYEDGWSRDIFIGCLFAISSFLCAYNGEGVVEAVLSKIAALAALVVVLFPCRCGEGAKNITAQVRFNPPYAHFAAAAVMFGVLAVFCFMFYKRARKKKNPQAKCRSYIYVACAITIGLVIAVLGIDNFTGHHLETKVPRLTFYGEEAALVAFAISWLLASRTIPVITAPGDRISILPVAAS
jgi:hypothetical protein